MMTHRFHMHLLAVATVVLAAATTWAAEGCRVVDPELRTSYVGGCNREGWAEGSGVAKGSAEYVGEFRAGKKHGRGVKTWPWGDRYVGDFDDDHIHGQGLYVWGAQSANAGDSYIGVYRTGKRHGRGIYRWASGERYEGTWENDKMTGPPTGMAVQRFRHQQALREAVVKVGVVVCRDYAVGIGAKQRVRGIVAQADAKNLRIAVQSDAELPVPIGGVAVRKGDVFWDDAANWEPCQ